MRGTGNGVILKKCECPTKRTCLHGWTLRWFEGGKQRERTFKDTLDGAGKRVYASGQQLAKDAQAEMTRGKRAGDETFADRKLGDVSFIAYCEGWIAQRRGQATRKTYMSTLNTMRAQLEGKSLRQVSSDRELAQRLVDTAPGTYRVRTRIVLVSPCNEAVKAGRLQGHRLKGLTVAPLSTSAEFQWVDRKQLDVMAVALGDRGLLVWLGRLCGLRIGESLGVNIHDFHDNGTMLRVSRQRMHDGSLSSLKSKDADGYRDIPVPAMLWTLVQKAPRDAEGYLFKANNRTTVMDAVKRAKAVSGVYEGFVPHALRHMYASELLEDGVPITDVAKFLGHTDIKITFATYGKHVKNGFDRTRQLLDSRWTA